MSTITNIGKAECKILSEEIEGVIRQTLDKYGLTASYAKGKYERGGHTATLSFKIDVPAMAEKAANREAKVLGAEFDMGYVFKSSGTEFEVTGFNMRRHKYPVSAKNILTGRQFKFPVETVNRHVEIAELFAQKESA